MKRISESIASSIVNLAVKNPQAAWDAVSELLNENTQLKKQYKTARETLLECEGLLQRNISAADAEGIKTAYKIITTTLHELERKT